MSDPVSNASPRRPLPVSPLAPGAFPDMPAIPGLTLAAAACGLRYRGRTDLMLAVAEPGCSVAGMLTRSTTPGAPVMWSREVLNGGRGRVLVVNAGNANVFAGPESALAVEKTAAAAAAAVGCAPDEVFVASTGVIGERLNYGRIVDALPGLNDARGPGGWENVASAIMTTDTFAKGATRTAKIGGVPVTINGFAKGSGMIAPNMATMLAFLFTDAAISAPVLQKLLASAVDRSFNAITVDGDTSTSDMALLFATGRAGHPPVTAPGDPALRGFKRALDDLTRDLAHQIVRDGEGASKFISINVSGAASRKAARAIAASIANSPLVKTAIAGEDANWGRIVMAVGKSGERIDPGKLRISIGGILITEDRGVRPDYVEAPVAAHMKGREIDIDVDVGVGRGKATVWTCDLTHGYIDINGAYRS